MRIEERIRAELHAQGNRLRVPAGDLGAVTARGRNQRRGRLAVALAGAAVVVAAVVAVGMYPSGGEGGGIPVGSGDTVTTTAAPSESTTTEPATTTTVAVSSTTVPPPPASPEIAVATPDGIVIVADGAVRDRIDIGPVMTAVGDLAGGHVVQIGMSASSILHLPAAGGGLGEIIAATDETLTLHDVVSVDGSATVVYTARLSNVSPRDAREDLRVYDIATGEDRLITQVGGYESGATQISYADGRFVVTMTAEGYTWFEAYALDGDPVPFNGNPRTEAESAEDFLRWVGVGALAPDSGSFGFVQGSPRSEAPFRLIIVDLPSGEVRSETELPAEARSDTIRRLDWDGEVAVISVTGAAGVVVADGELTGRLPAAGTADLGVAAPG